MRHRFIRCLCLSEEFARVLEADTIKLNLMSCRTTSFLQASGRTFGARSHRAPMIDSGVDCSSCDAQAKTKENTRTWSRFSVGAIICSSEKEKARKKHLRISHEGKAGSTD
jgi:hypothetical protein